MKRFEEYEKMEKATIIKNGGLGKRELEKAFTQWLDANRKNFPQDVNNVLNESDPILDIYGYCSTVEEVIELAKEYMEEE